MHPYKTLFLSDVHLKIAFTVYKTLFSTLLRRSYSILAPSPRPASSRNTVPSFNGTLFPGSPGRPGAKRGRWLSPLDSRSLLSHSSLPRTSLALNHSHT